MFTFDLRWRHFYDGRRTACRFSGAGRAPLRLALPGAALGSRADSGTADKTRANEVGSFGEQLRQAREAKHITLQEIAATTKISCRALQALEDEHFNQLPGGIFNKGFVRAYARYVGLDEEKMLAAYLAAAKVDGSPETDMQAMSSQVATARAGARDSSVSGTTVVGIAGPDRGPGAGGSVAEGTAERGAGAGSGIAGIEPGDEHAGSGAGDGGACGAGSGRGGYGPGCGRRSAARQRAQLQRQAPARRLANCSPRAHRTPRARRRDCGARSRRRRRGRTRRRRWRFRSRRPSGRGSA